MANKFCITLNARAVGVGRALVGICMLNLVLPMGSVSLAESASSDSPEFIAPELIAKLQANTVRVINGADSSSGVIVSGRGLVLTAAHGLPSGNHDSLAVGEPHESPRVRVILSDRTVWAADVLLADRKLDIGVIRLVSKEGVTPAAFPAAPIPGLRSPGPVKPVNEDRILKQPVLALGFPGREQGGLAALARLGLVTRLEKERLETSCLLTAGDSGGPLFLLSGELIGLHQRIGISETRNDHLRLTSEEVLRRLQPWRAEIEDTFEIADAAEIANAVEAAPLKTERVSQSGGLAVPAAAVQEIDSRIASIYFRTSDLTASPQILGTRINSGLIATKLSELKGEQRFQVRLADKRPPVEARLLAQESKLDLALLQIDILGKLGQDTEKSAESELELSDLLAAAPLAIENRVGRFVAGYGVDRLGMINRVGHDEVTGKSQYGSSFEDQPGKKPIVVRISAGGTAQKSGVEIGDEFESVSITGNPAHEVRTVEDLSIFFGEVQPGDMLTVGVIRGGQTRSLTAMLQHDAAGEFQRVEFLDGRSGRLSQRRTGFKGVLQYDLPVAPEQCGSPLVDASGRIIGVVIARRARESSLAIPIETVLEFASQSRSAEHR